MNSHQTNVYTCTACLQGSPCSNTGKALSPGRRCDLGRDPREGVSIIVKVDRKLAVGCGSMDTNHLCYPQPEGSLTLSWAHHCLYTYCTVLCLRMSENFSIVKFLHFKFSRVYFVTWQSGENF